MINFVPIAYYALIYYNFLLIVVIITWFNAQNINLTNTDNLRRKHSLGILVLVISIFWIGLRPITGSYFGDTYTYAKMFEGYSAGEPISSETDLGFHIFAKFCSWFMSVHLFFLLCAFLYIYPLYITSKKLFKSRWFYAFLILLSSFSFWGYGTNGIRNGIATSLFLLAIAFYDRKPMIITFLFLACTIHKSLLLPSLAYGFTLINNNPKRYLCIWLMAIPLSLLLGGFWENFFAGLGFGDERVGYLTSGNINNDNFSSTGFRWDFLVYSASGVYTGYYFVIKKNFKDKLYYHLLNVYLIGNAFWILVIRANFSNRFAYLSWFMLGLIIIYPFLKKRFFIKPHKAIGLVISVYFIFTYLMNVILVER